MQNKILFENEHLEGHKCIRQIHTKVQAGLLQKKNNNCISQSDHEVNTYACPS